MVEALESLARHGYRGTTAGRRLGPLRPVAAWGVQLIARYLVVSHIRDVSTTMRNLYALREMQALPGSADRRELRRARMDGERLVDALRRNSIGVPTFLVGGAGVDLRLRRARERPARGRALGSRGRRRGHADRTSRVVDDPARRGPRLAPHPPRDGGDDPGRHRRDHVSAASAGWRPPPQADCGRC